MLKCIGKIPRVIITDGLSSYSRVMEEIRRKAKYIYQQDVTRYLVYLYKEMGKCLGKKL